MFNYRRVDDRFSLSGGWNDLPADAGFLADEGIRFVLDLQFSPLEAPEEFAHTVRDYLKTKGIAYTFRAIWDGDYGQDFKDIISDTNAVLDSFVKLSDANPPGRILVKCAAGMSRSPAILLAYLCPLDGLSYSEAYQHLYRLNISMSPYFVRELKKLYGG